MTDAELDQLYTEICQVMTRLGERQASLFLARFALLAMARVGDPHVVRELIDAAAAHGMPAI
jgi:hypothetical protein